MSTLIVLTPEQVELVRHGVLPDSSFRPMPRSVVASFDSSTESRRRERRVTGERRVANRHQIEFLDRDVAAEHWKQRTVELALLIGNTDPPSHGPGPVSAVIALARASALGRRGSGATGVRRLEIRDWRLLPTPVLVNDIVGDLPPNEARWWRENLHSSSKPIPPSTDEATLRALRSRVPGFDAIAAAARRPSTPADGVEVAARPSLQEARDAGMSAMRVFSPDWRELRPTAVTDQPLAPELEQFLAAVTENDLIQDDIVPFDGWRQHRSQGGWVEFQSAGRRLLVKNINFKPMETITGADLIYWRSDPDAFVIVQYKVLTKDRDGFIHRINGQDRLPGQLEAMLACTQSDGTPPSTTTNFRLANTSAFVKFAYPMTKLHADNQLIDGHYLPADFVQLMYARPDEGRGGGKILRFPTARSIDPETFSRLVRDCWIGTSGKASTALHKLLPGLRDHPPAHLLVAYDEPLRRQNPAG
ncbi:hypothetical protein AB0893_26105 [Micromonospora aurantiaca]|uniref:hypothetical protein n=1 Tax=Micromonospora TaxID=1873 RepID=UPI00117F7C07|nr:hypothetical protein [Micromonospora sp. L5]